MSIHAAFRRQPVPGEMALQHSTVTLPAPIRGIIENENWAYTKPGAAVILDNWFPTQKGLRLRGGTEVWTALPTPVEPVRSGFSYVHGSTQRMFAATQTRLFDVTFVDTPTEVTTVGTISDGNFSTAQLATAGGDWLLAVNDSGDYVRRFDGTDWVILDPTYSGTPPRIEGPSPGPPAIDPDAGGLTHIWKHANRLFFIAGGTMNAFCLPVNSVGGELVYIPLSGAFKRGGSLLFGASWSVDSGSGLDDKCIFVTDQGEVAVFAGTDPTDETKWRQEGCYDISKPLGKNGHQKLAGDILIATVDGIVPLTATMQKDIGDLSMAAITYNIEPMWKREFIAKRTYPWVIAKWDEGDALFVNFPGGSDIQSKTVGVSNLHTGAWSRYTNWDALCFMQINGSLFFGTQDGKIMQAESGGTDDGLNYICTMVGGWEMFQVPPNQVTWFQARAAFFSSAHEPFEPQLAATVDYEFHIPPPPSPGPDPGAQELWDEGEWDNARWDQPNVLTGISPIRNTMWVSIGETGFSHAPIVQVNVAQQIKPSVELVSVSATYLRMAANV